MKTINPKSLQNLRKGGPGRKPGIPNRATLEIKAAATAIVERPDYVRKLMKRLDEGKAPHMETLLFYYAYGKPAETMKLSAPVILPPYVIIPPADASDSHE